MKTLKELAVQYGTDKCDGAHTFKGLSYIDIYERYFASLRTSCQKVLELGVKDGASLRMWSDYFPNALIFGVDNRPETALKEGRISTVTGNQQDADTFKSLPSEFDLIIDDASHVNPMTLASFDLLWPRIKPGGIYIIEDLRCSYSEFCGYQNERAPVDSFFQSKIKGLDYMSGDVIYVHFWSMLCLIGKAA